MEEMIGYCGLICTECEIYIATQANDLATLDALARRACEEYGMAGATPESAMCDGCLTSGGRLCCYCHQCPIRACGMEHGVINCSSCPEYACPGGCLKFDAFWQWRPRPAPPWEAFGPGWWHAQKR
jgi:hypothetical protein